MAATLPVPAADAWQVAAAAAAPRIEALSSSCRALELPPLHVLRSSQADALRLDAELGGMLHEQMGRLFEHFSPGQASQLEPELRAVLSLLVFGMSVWAGRATPGSELLNLRYRNEWAVAAGPKEVVGASGVEGPGLSRGQRIALGLGTAVLPYAWSRLCRKAHQDDWAEAEAGSWRRRAWRALRWCEGAVQLAAVVNSWVFLMRGDYRSLLERLVGARLVWRQATMTRIISFEYLNRQLVWQELSEALLLLLPLVDLARLRTAAMRVLPRPSPAATARAAAGTTEARSAREGQPGPAAGTGHTAAGVAAAAVAAADVGVAGAAADAAAGDGARGGVVAAGSSCPVCGADDILTAVRALPCGHVFCYYCLRSNTLADVSYSCPLDGVRVAAMRRVGAGGAKEAAKAVGRAVRAAG